MDNQTLKEKDLKYIFHPCSQMKDYETIDLIPIKSAKGMYLYDYDGNKYLDCISSWWVNLFGHCNEYINDILIKQANTLEHTIFAGFTHKPAIDLSQRLIDLTPNNLQKIFFADNGSSAVEIALKMSFQYHKNKNKNKKYFVSLDNSYHGETIGALSVSDLGLYKEVYKEILIESIHAKSPALVDENEAIQDMEKIFKENKNNIISVIIEPLVQCAGSMKMYKPSYLQKLRLLCDKYDVFIIADEVAVGFGRTGSMFAFSQANIEVDFLCLSKGITAGYLPLSVVLFSDDIYNAFYCNYNEGKSFLDSHSYTGNALACAVANGVLDIFENENIIEKNKLKIALMKELGDKFVSLENVKEIRQTGMIFVIELKKTKADKRINFYIFQEALKKEIFIRPLTNNIYFMPPYVISKEEIKYVFDSIYKIIKNIPNEYFFDKNYT
jgi:adenosylmethionine-8-amino-7-oxononanoate aminotransferase